MKALVAVRAVLDDERFSDAALGAPSGPFVASPNDDFAAHIATTLAPGSTVAVSVQQPARAEPALRRALALGATLALCVWDDTLVEADVAVTARVLAAVAGAQSARLLVFGAAGADAGTRALPGYVAELLGWPCVDEVVAAQIEADDLVVTRWTESGAREVLAVPLPAAIAVASSGVTAPYPTLAARLRAERAPIQTLRPAEVGVDGADALRPRIRVDRVTLPKPTCAVPMRAAHPSPEVRAALALAGPMGSGAAPRSGAEAVTAAVRALQEAGVITREEGTDT